jgi:hypothetical protein
MLLIALHWWDKTTKSLCGMLCNNSGPAACDFNTYSNSSLNWNGKELTIDIGFAQDGKKMIWHEVWSGITATAFYTDWRHGGGRRSAETSSHNSWT